MDKIDEITKALIEFRDARDWKQFHKTTEDKKWLKESLTEVCNKTCLFLKYEMHKKY